MTSKTVELCRVTTADGLLLDGSLVQPGRSAPNLGIDACVLIHGTGSNFTTPGLLETFAEQSNQAGLPVLRVNTRGHDLMARIPRKTGSVLGGAAYESISDCRHDLTAWVEFLIERGLRRVALVGHSMGGVKAIYAVSRGVSAGVAALVAISPPRFHHTGLLRHKLASQFREDYRRAEALVARGEGETILQVRQPLSLVMPASGFVAKYGPHDDYDILKLLPHVACPTLVLIGSESAKSSPAFEGLAAHLTKLASHQTRLTVRTIEGADISYASQPGAPFEAMVEWLREV